jgi:hypothetical protein
MKKIKLFITFTSLLLVSSRVLQADTSYPLSSYAEMTTAVLRGPLAALSHHNHGKYTDKAKAIHVAADVVRLANELLTIVNHPGDYHFSSSFWAVFDLINLYIDLFKKDEESSDNLINLNTEHTELINILGKVSQTCLLPLTESTTTLYRAMNVDQTPQGSILRRQEEAFCSLARAISIFLNHQHSEPALTLLLAAVTETILAISNYPRIDVTPEPIIIPLQLNQTSNNAINLENNQQQQNNLDDPEEEEEEEEELIFYDAPDHPDDEELQVHDNNPEHVMPALEDDDNNNDEEEFIFYDAPDHPDDEEPQTHDNNPEHVMPALEDDDNNDDEEEFIFYDAPDHPDDEELPSDGDNPKKYD